MKRIAIILTCAITAGCIFGCADGSNGASTVSDDESSVSESATAKPNLNQTYKFLKSKYTVTASSERHGIRYVYDYYFVDGTVAGLRQRVTFPDPESARTYYTEIVRSCPEAIINACTVTYYIGEDAYCYGFSLDKLKFQLDNASYPYTVNFDEEEFSDKFDASKARTVTPQA